MNTTISLDYQINRAGFWSGIVAIATGVVSIFLPLDAPGGYAAEHVDRVAWQIVEKNPLRAIVAAAVVLIAVVAFIIPKFMAVWTIPLLAEVITSGTVGAELADPLLRLLNVSIPFSLFTSFDYLGFWLYGVFGLLVARPLYGQAMSAKIAAVALGAFGVVYHIMLVALLVGMIAPVDIEAYFMSVSMLLLFLILAMIFNFKDAMSSRA